MASNKADARPSQLSEEYVQDSSDEDEEDAEDAGIRKEPSKESVKDDSTRKTFPNGVTPASEQQDTPASESSASSNSSQESSSPGGEGNKSDVEHSNASSGSKKRRSEQEKVTETVRSSKKQKKSKETTPVQIPSKAFVPPPGFEAVRPDASDYASDAAAVFTDLSDKQVWHITAPATVNLNSIKEFDISAALKGEPIITQNGVSYGLQPTNSSTDTLLLPEDGNEAYRPSKTRISRGFQLKAIDQEGDVGSNTSIPENSGSPNKGKLVFTAQAPGQTLPPRQQPAGLSTRYVPYGVVDRDKSTNGARTFAGLDEPILSERATANITSNPPKSKSTTPAAKHDRMEVDENLPTSNGALEESLQKPADPSPVKSSISDTPREKQKKKKKKSKLVDDPGI